MQHQGPPEYNLMTDVSQKGLKLGIVMRARKGEWAPHTTDTNVLSRCAIMKIKIR